MPTSMTQARSTLPAHLQRARLATIAKDPAFRRYFASADDSATIRKVLVRQSTPKARDESSSRLQERPDRAGLSTRRSAARSATTALTAHQNAASGIVWLLESVVKSGWIGFERNGSTIWSDGSANLMRDGTERRKANSCEVRRMRSTTYSGMQSTWYLLLNGSSR